MTVEQAPVLPVAVAASREIVEPVLARAIATLHPRLARVADYHRGAVEADGQPVSGSRGKAMRPALALMGAAAAGVDAHTAAPGAAAVELVHDFSLLHDDVMDGDTSRRSRPTAWTVFGVGAAVLAGDALLALAQRVLDDVGGPAGARARSLLDDTVIRLVAGQMDDLDFESSMEVGLEDYARMAGGKTAALLSCACAIGAALGGADAAVVDGLAAFGEHLGLAFQLVDDILGIWGDPRRTGKPVLSDLRSRKKTAPVLAALAAGSPAAAPLLAHLAGIGDVDEAELRRLAELVEDLGGRAATEADAERHLELAADVLRDLPLEPQPVADLLATARFVTARDC